MATPGTKTVLTDNAGTVVDVAVPRDRAGTFEPVIVGKHQRKLPGVEELALSPPARQRLPDLPDVPDHRHPPARSPQAPRPRHRAITGAEAEGHTRVAAMKHQVLTNLEAIITALDQSEDSDET